MSDAEAKAQRPIAVKPRKRRRWIWLFASVFGVLFAVVAAGVVLLDLYADDIVRQALADADLPNPRLQVDSIGLTGSRLVDVRLGDDDALVAEAIELDYDIIDLIDLEPKDLILRLTRPTLKLAVDDTGRISFGSLDRLMEGGSGDAPTLPFRRIVLDRATVLVATPEGELIAQLDGKIENLGADGLAVSLTALADNDLILFDGDLALTIAADGSIGGEANLRGVDARTPWGRIEQGSGTLSLAWSGQGIPTGSVDLTVATIAVPPVYLPALLTEAETGLHLTDARIVAVFDGAAVNGSLSATDESGGNAVALDIAVADVISGGPATITADLSTAGQWLLWPIRADWAGDGTLTATIDAAITVPPLAKLLADPQTAATLPAAQVSVQWLLSGADFPGVARGVSSIGDIELALSDGMATLTSADPVEVRIGAVEASALDSLAAGDPAWADILSSDLAGRIDMAVEGRAARPLTITIAHGDGGWAVSGEATILAATDAGPLVAAELSGEVTIGETLEIALPDLSVFASEIRIPALTAGVIEAAGRFAYRDGVPDFDLAAAVSDLSLTDPQLSFARVAIELAMASTDDGLAGPLTATFADAGGTIEEVMMTGLTGELTGRLDWTDGVARLFFTEDAVFRLEAMDIDGDVIFSDPSIVRVTASENPVLELDTTAPDGPSLRHSLNIGPLDLRGSIRMGDDRVVTALRTPTVIMEGGYLEGRYVLHLEVVSANANAPARGWTIGGARVVIDYDDNDTENLLLLQASVARVGSGESDGRLPPMGMRGLMRYGLDDVIRITARAFDDRNLLIADVTANHDIDTNLGSADIEVQDLIFTPGVLQPFDISPLLRDFENVTGTVDIEGTIRWSGSTITPDLALLISDMTGDFDDVAFERMNSVVQLAGLSPLRTQPSQLLSIARVDPGVPISNAEVIFSLENGNTLVIEQATFDLAGGVVSAQAQLIEFSSDEQAIELIVTGVDLDTLLALADLESLEAQGTLDGSIPILVVDGDVVIPEAWLAARAPGYIRYDAGADLGAVGDSNAGVDLMVELLKNFLFDELNLRLMRPVAGDMQVGFRILGHNPDVYGGVPIDLTLNVDGELEDVIQNSLDIYRVPETIQDLILQYGFDAVNPPG